MSIKIVFFSGQTNFLLCDMAHQPDYWACLYTKRLYILKSQTQIHHRFFFYVGHVKVLEIYHKRYFSDAF